MSALLSKIEAFMVAHRMSPTDFGRAALSDPNFVSDLRGKGHRSPRQPTAETVERVLAFMNCSQEETKLFLAAVEARRAARQASLAAAAAAEASKTAEAVSKSVEEAALAMLLDLRGRLAARREAARDAA